MDGSKVWVAVRKMRKGIPEVGGVKEQMAVCRGASLRSFYSSFDAGLGAAQAHE